jgi:hypothetical protein
MGEKQPSACRMKSTAPYFLVDDVVATAEYYRDVLGFSVDEFFGVPPSFTIVSRDSIRILLRQVRPARAPVARPNRSVMDETFDAYVWSTTSMRSRPNCAQRKRTLSRRRPTAPTGCANY